MSYEKLIEKSKKPRIPAKIQPSDKFLDLVEMRIISERKAKMSPSRVLPDNIIRETDLILTEIRNIRLNKNEIQAARDGIVIYESK